MDRKEARHNYYLNSLIWRLNEIGEDKRGISWIMKEGIWMKEDKRLPMPDIIADYIDGHFLIVELKGSRSKKNKALEQINSGERFVRYNFRPACIIRKFVVYEKGSYYWEGV